MKTFFGLSVLLCSAIVHAQNSWAPENMIKFNRITGAVISPDGKHVAYTISTPSMEGEKSEFVTHIWLAATDGSSNRKYTFGEKSCASPQFSPDGRWLSFTSPRNAEGRNQLFILPLNGGEAEQITSLKGSLSTYKWSPDGTRIAFVMSEPLTDLEEKDQKEKRDMVVMDDFRNSHLYTVSLSERDSKNACRIKRLTAGDFHVTALDWSPDNKNIVFTHQVNSSADLWMTSDISMIPADSGALKPLVTGAGFDGNPMFSPDGQHIAFVSDDGNARWARRTSVYLVAASGGDKRKLAPTFDENPQIFAFSPDGKNVFFSESLKTARVVYSLSVEGKPAKMLTQSSGLYSSPSMNKTGEMLAYVYEEASLAPQVVAMNIKDRRTRTLSRVNEEFSKLPHARTEVISWRARDGKFEIEGLVTYPANYEKGRKYPLILNIHGGPAGVFSENYTGASAVYPIQTFSENGFAVLRVNPRGSSGYGGEFRTANMNDWGYGDYEDIMAGVDKLIADGVVHADSLCVTGWSYGGYMTSMIITRTNRFKAAMVGAGVTNLVSFTGTADIPGFIPDYFGGEMWDRTEVYMKHSAMFAVKNVKTPTLIVHGERDARVPMSQGLELYMALKRLGVKTQMVTYPRTPHGPQEPKFIQDIAARVISWFDENCRQQPGKIGTSSLGLK